jgi:glycerophosphoryl diester phosphodiesterase
MAWSFLDVDTPFGFAHQGGDEVAPGNTMAAFEHAVSLGFDYIETDVQATADRVLVVFHDDDLARLANVDARIEDLSWEEVSQLRVAEEYPIPRFDEVVERFDDVRFNIDPKTNAAVGPLVAAIVHHELADRVMVGSFSDKRVRSVRSGVGDRLATSPGPLGLAGLLVRALVPSWGSTSYAAVQIPTAFKFVPLTTSFLIRRFHRLGLQVHVWTINTEAEMIDLLDRDVDAIITDRPSVLKRVLRDRGAWPEDGGPTS